MAFYTGSLEGPDGSGAGRLQYALADELCAEFKTCGPDSAQSQGKSYVNHQIFKDFDIGLALLLEEKCDDTRLVKEEIVALSKVPLVQGTLRASYPDNNSEKSKGASAAFAASVLPFVHACSAEDANIIYTNVQYDTNTDFAAVKAALERNYDCMGLTCEQVGGLWDKNINSYKEGAAPCVDSNARSVGATAATVIACFIAYFLLTALVVKWFRSRRRERGALLEKQITTVSYSDSEEKQDKSSARLEI